MVAAATLKPLPETMTSGGAGLSSLTGKLEGMMSVFNTPAPPRVSGPPPEKKPVPSEMLMTQLPLPPARPASIEVAKAEPDAPGPEARPDEPASGSLPLPPKRPLLLVAYTPSLSPIPFMRKIAGSQPILPTKFVPFEKAKI